MSLTDFLSRWRHRATPEEIAVGKRGAEIQRENWKQINYHSGTTYAVTGPPGAGTAIYRLVGTITPDGEYREVR